MRLLLTILFIAFTASSALAGSGAALRCEDPGLQQWIRDGLKDMRFESPTGSNTMSYGVYFEDVTNFKTVSSSKNKVICSVRVHITARGQRDSYRARVTYQALPNGKASVTISVGG